MLEILKQKQSTDGVCVGVGVGVSVGVSVGVMVGVGVGVRSGPKVVVIGSITFNLNCTPPVDPLAKLCVNPDDKLLVQGSKNKKLPVVAYNVVPLTSLIWEYKVFGLKVLNVPNEKDGLH